jgi:hypothetical protein
MPARYAVLPSPSRVSGPRLLPLYKLQAPINHAESTLLQVLILKQLKVPLESIAFEKQGGGYPIMVNQVLETSHPLSLPNVQTLRRSDVQTVFITLSKEGFSIKSCDL